MSSKDKAKLAGMSIEQLNDFARYCHQEIAACFKSGFRGGILRFEAMLAWVSRELAAKGVHTIH